jgi:REP element-mobilizing transposase RayT
MRGRVEIQGELDFRVSTHGGRRAGAGRKKTGRAVGPAHRARPTHKRSEPVHVVLRVMKREGRLRRGKILKVVRRVLRVTVERPGFRIVHTSMQHNHLHLIVEAESKATLAAGMQITASLLARAINRAWGRRGKLFAHRYHATALATPRQCRNALAYVLNNWRRHNEDKRGGFEQHGALDPYATGMHFDGWREPVGDWARVETLPAAAPRTWILREGWRRGGPRLSQWMEPGAV